MFHAIWKPRAVCRLHAMQSADCAATVSMNYMHVCALERDNFKENRENCNDFIVLYCVRNWEGISVVENLVRFVTTTVHSVRTNLSLFPPITSKKTNNNHCQKDRGYFPLG